MKVEFIAHTPFALQVVADAAHTCYSSDASPAENPEELVRKTLKSGHDSVLEHVSFTFLVKGISRVATHQLVRHRMASYSQESLRYVSATNAPMYVPVSVTTDRDQSDAYVEYESAMSSARDAYNKLIKLGIPKEDARYVLPMAVETNITLTMNVRELRHFFALRCCNRAQEEIRYLADRMLYYCKETEPVLFENAGPACVTGGCHETRPCGNPRVDLR